MRLSRLALASALALPACGSNADVAGTYTVSLTSQANECNLANWNEGNTSSGVPLVITQEDEDLVAEVQGVAAAYLTVALGNNEFVGSINGEDARLTLYGTQRFQRDGCSFTLNVDMRATFDGDFVRGSLTYRPVTNESPSCGKLSTCRNRQTFNGNRPPR